MSQQQNRQSNQREGEGPFPQTDYSKLEHVTVSLNRPSKWYMYITKRVLKERGEVSIRSRPSAAGQVVRVAEALKRLEYIDYVSFKTTTLESMNSNLVRFFVIKVKKAKEFDKLYDAREEERKKVMEETNKAITTQKK